MRFLSTSWFPGITKTLERSHPQLARSSSIHRRASPYSSAAPLNAISPPIKIASKGRIRPLTVQFIDEGVSVVPIRV